MEEREAPEEGIWDQIWISGQFQRAPGLGESPSHSSPTKRGFEIPDGDPRDHNGMYVALGDRRNSVLEFPGRRWNFRNFPLGKNRLETRVPMEDFQPPGYWLHVPFQALRGSYLLCEGAFLTHLVLFNSHSASENEGWRM